MYWKLCQKYCVKCVDQNNVWFKEVLYEMRVSVDGNVEILWDRCIRIPDGM